jgi:hypothetical protein
MRGAAKRGREEEGEEKEKEEEKEEEVCAMMGYVLGDLAEELYIELLEGFHK